MADPRDDFAFSSSQQDQSHVRRPTQPVSMSAGRRQTPLPTIPVTAAQAKGAAPPLPSYPAPLPPQTPASNKWTDQDSYVYEKDASLTAHHDSPSSNVEPAAPMLPSRSPSPHTPVSTANPGPHSSGQSQRKPQLPPRQPESSSLSSLSFSSSNPFTSSERNTQGPPPIPMRPSQPSAVSGVGEAPPLPGRLRSVSNLPNPSQSTPVVAASDSSQPKGLALPPLPPRRGAMPPQTTSPAPLPEKAPTRVTESGTQSIATQSTSSTTSRPSLPKLPTQTQTGGAPKAKHPPMNNSGPSTQPSQPPTSTAPNTQPPLPSRPRANTTQVHLSQQTPTNSSGASKGPSIPPSNSSAALPNASRLALPTPQQQQAPQSPNTNSAPLAGPPQLPPNSSARQATGGPPKLPPPNSSSQPPQLPPPNRASNPRYSLPPQQGGPPPLPAQPSTSSPNQPPALPPSPASPASPHSYGNNAPPPIPSRQSQSAYLTQTPQTALSKSIPEPASPSPSPSPQSFQSFQSFQTSPMERKMAELINQGRESEGLPPLVLDEQISCAAREKAEDMAQTDKFSYESPTCGSIPVLMYKYGFFYSDLHLLFAVVKKPESALLQVLQRSPDDLLSIKATHVGVGHVEKGQRPVWVIVVLQKYTVDIPVLSPSLIASLAEEHRVMNASNRQRATQDGMVNIHEFELQVIELTNKERERFGLSPLEWHLELGKVARVKALDMGVHKVMSHDSPIYGSFSDLILHFNIKHNRAGENIFQVITTPLDAVIGWMNSPGHRKNILTPEFTHIGVGVDLETWYWAQQFIQKPTESTMAFHNSQASKSTWKHLFKS